MKKLLYLFLLLGLSLSSCKKEDSNKNAIDNSIEYNGKVYSLEFLTSEMSKRLEVSQDSLIFHPDIKAFTVLDYPETKWYLSRIIKDK
ncbi:hypothetical protein FAZ19_14895 [Sphingobacterium alkalisoli]|uniref:Uncharacterized protein n=1 Tax=Sphingobacterium alkalisoli TaxID=1874115 RepID=A0A4U0H2J1_9SPHI|nr:hypothetical protein [Sphingobacterium alkalisoli]TJY64482.1 hypothetical protein FAZ19_14895 [Sphingobacterium alkalisoli]GGH21484.1 hypothetical protein GCM10011418_27390 [Sphingobacterium alkalisoli]